VNKRLKNSLIIVANTLYNSTATEVPRRCELPTDPFLAMNEYFDAIWVLTISRNASRRAHMQRQLPGVKFEFFEGVDGKTITETDPRFDFERGSARNGRPFKLNEAAAAFSHYCMLKAVVDRGVRRALLFEDDAALVPAARRWIPYCLERLPDDWELFYLGYQDGELRGYLREVQERFGRPRNHEEIVSRTVGRGLRTAAGHELIHAYAVTHQGARRLLEGMYPICDNADNWYEEKVLTRQVISYISIPKIFVQQSDLGSSIWS
jgi:GR25 family glycosyltransferase involved in LPS biosynthesis